nr:immunoglobulin heavy chain junction region [Mus musculus]
CSISIYHDYDWFAYW